MSVLTPILYVTPSDFTYDSTKLQVQGNVAQLSGTGPYDTSNPSILYNTELYMSAISAFAATLSAAGSDAVKFIIQIAGQDYYWNGSAWVASDGTYSKSNTAAAVNTNCGHASMNTLLTGGAKVKIKAVLHSNDGTTTPTLTEVDITYTFAAIKPSAPPLTTVYLWLVDIADNVIGSLVNAKLSVNSPFDFKYGSYGITKFNKTVTFDSNGYAAISVIETASVGVPLNFSISYLDGKTTRQINFIPAAVPNAGAIALTSFTQVSGQASAAAAQAVSPAPNNPETQETIANNETSPQNLSLILDPSASPSAQYRYTIRRYDGTNFYRESGRLIFEFDDSTNTWSVETATDKGSSGPSTGVRVGITTGIGSAYLGRANYISDDMSGTPYKGTIRYANLWQFSVES